MMCGNISISHNAANSLFRSQPENIRAIPHNVVCCIAGFLSDENFFAVIVTSIARKSNEFNVKKIARLLHRHLAVLP